MARHAALLLAVLLGAAQAFRIEGTRELVRIFRTADAPYPAAVREMVTPP
jgi:hypothetical protein